MSSEYSGETASAASASWSLWTLSVFTSGIFFGSVIAGTFLFWKSSLQAKFRALLGCLLPSSHSHPSPAGHQDKASEQPMDSNISQDRPLGQEETAPTHPLDSKVVQGSPSSQEDSTSTHLQSRPPSPQRGYKYDVFLSFRYTDPCNKFIDNLFRCLDREQISTFKNGKRLEEGEPISRDLLQAIRDSKISIVVFSRDYAASTRCLEEMAAIVDCQEEFALQKKFKLAFPVFYDVHPSDVRYQKEMYESAFILHTQKFKEDPGKVDRWKTAMRRLSDLSGFHTGDEPEHIVIEDITKTLLKALGHKFSRSADDLVGTQPCVEDSKLVQGSLLSQEDSTSTHLQTRPPSPQHVYKYDVFLNFSGVDTRNTFTDHLYNHLTKNGILAFRNDKTLESGKPFPSQLLEAVKDSLAAVIVFSRDYAASTWCLEEMAAIVDCQKEFELVVPVFYDVDPSDVRYQTGMYENAFILYTQKFKEDPGKVDRWKTAMRRLSNLSGFDARDKPEHIVIENITKWLLKALVHKFSRSADDLVGIQPFHKFSRLADDLVGIQPCVEELEKHLKLGWEDDSFRILGICGMSGVGKTNCAMALYGKIFHQFDACCFIQNVGQIYRRGGVVAVQKKILSQTSNEQNLEIFDPFEISRSIRKMLSSKRVLIVLDDVDELGQLETLAISPKLLGSGSRIIIITRDEHLLKVYGADKIYKVPLLNDKDAHALFLRKAFNSKIPDDKKYLELIPKILEYAQNLRIAVEVLGSFLRDKDVIYWENFLERKGNFPITEEFFQKSFEELHPNEKEIFLHIACFFHGEKEESVKQVLDSCGLYPHTGIHVIKDRSLIIINNGEIHMHEMLQELGRKIVRATCPEKPGSWSRIWLYKDFESVLMSETGTNNVKAIVLNEKEDISKCAQLRIEGLSKMGDLQLLILYHINFSGELKHLSNNLRYLLWHGYPFSSLPLFEPYSRLVELNLPNSRIERLWKGHKNFPYLDRVDLRNSENLMETPNFEGCPNLKWLNFTGCTNLKLVHPSIGFLTKLEFLLLRGCTNLDDIPDNIYNLTSLAALDTSGCKIRGNLKETKFKEINQQQHGPFDLSFHVEPISAATAAAKSSPSPPKAPLSLAHHRHHQKLVLKVEINDNKIGQKAMKAIAALSGVESISFDRKDKKLTVIGDIDAVIVVGKLRKVCYAEIVSVGPATEEKKETCVGLPEEERKKLK